MLWFSSFGLIFFQVFFFLGSLCEGEISCLNEDGQPVDWYMEFNSFPISFCFWQSFGNSTISTISTISRFIIYKLPKYKQGSVGSGVDYMYLDSSLPNWHMSKYVVNTTDGALGRTLNQLYQRYEVWLYVYNNYILYLSYLCCFGLFFCLWQELSGYFYPSVWYFSTFLYISTFFLLDTERIKKFPAGFKG